MAVFFTNLGGVFNMLAYTLLRRMSLGVKPESDGETLGKI